MTFIERRSPAIAPLDRVAVGAAREPAGPAHQAGRLARRCWRSCRYASPVSPAPARRRCPTRPPWRSSPATTAYTPRASPRGRRRSPPRWWRTSSPAAPSSTRSPASPAPRHRRRRRRRRRPWSRPIGTGSLRKSARHPDMTVEPALTPDQATAAIEAGIEVARDLIDGGAHCLLTGDMGIANTTPAAALIAVFTGPTPARSPAGAPASTTPTLRPQDRRGPRPRSTGTGRRRRARSRPRRGRRAGTRRASPGSCSAPPRARTRAAGRGDRRRGRARGRGARPRRVGGSGRRPPVRRAGPRRGADQLGLSPLVDLGLRLGEGTGAAAGAADRGQRRTGAARGGDVRLGRVSREVNPRPTRSACASTAGACSSSAAGRWRPGACRRCWPPARTCCSSPRRSPRRCTTWPRRAGDWLRPRGSSRPMWTARGWCRSRWTTRRRPPGQRGRARSAGSSAYAPTTGTPRPPGPRRSPGTGRSPWPSSAGGDPRRAAGRPRRDRGVPARGRRSATAAPAPPPVGSSRSSAAGPATRS